MTAQKQVSSLRNAYFKELLYSPAGAHPGQAGRANLGRPRPGSAQPTDRPNRLDSRPKGPAGLADLASSPASRVARLIFLTNTPLGEFRP